MAKFNSKKQETRKAPERREHSYTVTRAKEFKDGGVVFDLTIDDITVYGCRVASGPKGDFVSFPSRKGKDDKYYSIVYLRLTEDETGDILDKVSAALAEQ